jgi:hypothetical protein
MVLSLTPSIQIKGPIKLQENDPDPCRNTIMHIDVDAFATIELYIFADDKLKRFREVTAHRYLGPDQAPTTRILSRNPYRTTRVAVEAPNKGMTVIEDSCVDNNKSVFSTQ